MDMNEVKPELHKFIEYGHVDTNMDLDLAVEKIFNRWEEFAEECGLHAVNTRFFEVYDKEFLEDGSAHYFLQDKDAGLVRVKKADDDIWKKMNDAAYEMMGPPKARFLELQDSFVHNPYNENDVFICSSCDKKLSKEDIINNDFRCKHCNFPYDNLTSVKTTEELSKKFLKAQDEYGQNLLNTQKYFYYYKIMIKRFM